MSRFVVPSAATFLLLMANACGPASDARTGGSGTSAADLTGGSPTGSFPGAAGSCGASTCAADELCCDNLVCEPACMKVSRCPVYGVACPVHEADAGSPVSFDASPSPIQPSSGGWSPPITVDGSSSPPPTRCNSSSRW